jgi:hypothetical protein
VCKINGVSLLTAKLPLFHSRACWDNSVLGLRLICTP